jgi:hypothetical protein
MEWQTNAKAHERENRMKKKFPQDLSGIFMIPGINYYLSFSFGLTNIHIAALSMIFIRRKLKNHFEINHYKSGHLLLLRTYHSQY